ncbi:hypothetical protein AGR9A_Cc210026 [Agrobacterium salinitolerans str. Hayward 0363]|nr:hypothetical protein AGR9A_Cc210026 [Agrobacterium salinitolerans str. Hayward 0363]
MTETKNGRSVDHPFQGRSVIFVREVRRLASPAKSPSINLATILPLRDVNSSAMRRHAEYKPTY